MNNNCNCTPIKTIYISSVTTTASGVVLIPSTQITPFKLANLNKYRLIIACNLIANSNLPIYIQTTSGNVPLWCKFAGNNVFPDQLKKRYCYTIVYGNNNVLSSIGQFVLQNCICPTSGRGTVGILNVELEESEELSLKNSKNK